MSTLLEIFNKEFSNTKIDIHLAKAIYKYQLNFAIGNKTNLEFFSSNLLGVHVINFKDKTILELFNICNIDYDILERKVHKCPNINVKFKISSDVFNLTIMYLLHRFTISEDLSEDVRKRATLDCALLFNYRTIAALISNNFRYACDERVAQLAYSNLSNKFLIKQLGSWKAVMDYRANALISRQSIHYDTIRNFDDLRVVYMVNDAQGSVRDMVKGYYNVFIAVHRSGKKIQLTSSSIMDSDGDLNIRDKTNSLSTLISKVQNELNNVDDWVKEDYLQVVLAVSKNTNRSILQKLLVNLVKQYSVLKNRDFIDQFIQDTLVISFNMLANNASSINKRDYLKLLTISKNLYLATRSEEKDLLELREKGIELIEQLMPDLNSFLIMSCRTSLFLYITLVGLVNN